MSGVCVMMLSIKYDLIGLEIRCADIIFLQETYVDKHISEKIGRAWPGLHFHAFSSSNHSRGVSTLLSKNKNFKVTSHFVAGDGRILLVNLNVDDVDITAVNIYAPNNSNDRIVFFKKVHAFIIKNKIDNSHIIIAGDFNCNVDKIKTGASKDPSEKYFTKLMSSFNLLDMWSHCHPDKPGFTYTSTARRAFYGS